MPVYNQAEYTEQCLYALIANTDPDPNYGLVVVDNGSSDWTRFLLHAFEGDVEVINNDENVGFARACNRGAELGSGDYLLFLNNDTNPHPGWLKRMVELADCDAAVGIVGAKLLYPDSGKVQHAGLGLENGIPAHLYRGAEADDPRVSEVRDVDMVTGACLLIRRSLFAELGGFDPAFHNGVEDVDLCLKARDLGYRVVFCPHSVVDHYEGASAGRFDQARENLQLFVRRWGKRFDDEGRFHPQRTEPAPTYAPPPGVAISAGGELPAKLSPLTAATAALGSEVELAVIAVDELSPAQRELLQPVAGSNFPFRVIASDDGRGMGQVLEEIRRAQRAAYVLFIGDEFPEIAVLTQVLLVHLRNHPEVGMITPCLLPQEQGSGIVDVEFTSPHVTLIRGEALDSVGGFEPVFRSTGALDEAARACRYRGWRVVCARDCFLGDAGRPSGDELLARRERNAVRALEEGDRLRTQGDKDAALAAYRHALESKSDFVEAIMVVCALLLECGRAAEAADIVGRLVEFDAKSVPARNYLGQAQYQAGRFDAARISFTRALELEPNHVESLVNLSVLEWEQGEAEAAVEYIERAAAADPSNREVIVNTGLMQTQLGDSESALALLRAFSEGNPADVEVKTILADLELQSDKNDRALAQARQVLNLQPDHLSARSLVERLGGDSPGGKEEA